MIDYVRIFVSKNLPRASSMTLHSHPPVQPAHAVRRPARLARARPSGGRLHRLDRHLVGDAGSRLGRQLRAVGPVHLRDVLRVRPEPAAGLVHRADDATTRRPASGRAVCTGRPARTSARRTTAPNFRREQVGTVTFTPTNSWSGTLTYNVNAVNVTKSIQRLTLTTIPVGGNYYGGIYEDIYDCANSSQNGVIRLYSEFVVAQTTQDTTSQLKIDFAVENGVCTMSGRYYLRTARSTASRTRPTRARPASTRRPSSPASSRRSRASRASGPRSSTTAASTRGYFSAVLN